MLPPRWKMAAVTLLGVHPSTGGNAGHRTIFLYGTHFSAGMQAKLAELQTAMTRDKKNRVDGLRFVILNSLGQAATRSGISPAMVEAVWRELGAV